MPHVEAGACGKPVIAINAMAFRDTLVHGKTAFLAGVAEENRISETTVYESPSDHVGYHKVFDPPRIADYRANVDDLAAALLQLMNDPELRNRMGAAGRQYVVEHFDYRVVAKQFLSIVSNRLDLPTTTIRTSAAAVPELGGTTGAKP